MRSVGPLEDALRSTERRRLHALVDRDMAVARDLHADDYQLIPPDGSTYSKEEYLGAIEHGELVYDVFEPASPIAVRAYGDAAVLRYQARIDIHGDGWRDTGLFWHTDVYERRDGRWLAAWSQATRISESG